MKPGGAIRSRTGLDGFAIRCITALLSRQGLLWLTFSAKKKGSLSFPVFLNYYLNLERDKRLELSTYTLARYRSTN